MGRWHDETCPGADVYLHRDGPTFPRCRNCNGSAEETIRSLNQTAESALPRVPPDEPPGQMNLRWPPSAPYKRRQASSASGTDGAQAVNPSASTSQSSTNAWPKPLADRGRAHPMPVVTPIYEDTLTGNDFRLLYLPAAQVPDEPIHVMLETYQHGNCPEYETVSYTWGGENDDSHLNHVIYVGNDWDILLQTKNCWQMLSWLQPRRGSRMVWVDAICINQENLDERGHQVARMEQIYSECSQVILWLGSDIVTQRMETYPRRYRFNDIQSVLGPLEANHVRIQDIFKRRYFGRVWVIQELVLAPRVVIPIQDCVFWLDGSPLSLPRNVAWEHTGAPWFTRVTLRALLAQDTFDLLALTSNSQASDVRDRIFGVLGLQANQETGLQADYNLSSQHVFVGFFSHSLIHDRRLEVLGHAGGMSDGRSHLTWTPRWKSHHAWSEIFHTPERHSSQSLEATIKGLSQTQDPMHLRLISQCGNSGRATTEVFKRRPWYKDCSVDADTGALSVYLTSLFVIKSRLQHLCPYAGLQVYQLEAGQTAKPLSVFLVSSSPLDTLVEVDDRLFLLDPGVGTILYLILRPTQQSRAFQLVAVCSHVVFQDREPDDYRNRGEDTTIMLEDIQSALFRDLKLLKTYFASTHSGFRRKLDLWLKLVAAGQTIDPQRWDRQWLSHVKIFLTSIRETPDNAATATEQTPDRAQRQYLETIPEHFQPRLDGNHIVITFRPGDWELLWANSSYTDDANGWEWCREGTDRWQKLGPDSRGPKTRIGHPPRCKLRREWQEIRSSIETEVRRLGMDVLYKQGALGETEEDVVGRIRRGPTTEDYFTGTLLRGHSYQGRGSVRGTRIQGSTYQVQIV